MSRTVSGRPWEKAPNETAKAYAAFCAYRDLGPDRSIDKAYGTAKPGKQRNGRPVEWHRWSTKFEWVKRAESFDEFADEFKRREFEARLRKLANDQADFAVEEFSRLVQRVRKADRILDKADAHPITDIEVIEEETSADGKPGKRKRKKIGGINFAGYAGLMKEIRESAKRAILGPRDDSAPTAPANPANEIEWERPLDRAA